MNNSGIWASNEQSDNIDLATATGAFYTWKSELVKGETVKDYFGSGKDAVKTSFEQDVVINNPGPFHGGKHNSYAMVFPVT